ncbi:hypothetical protein HDU76_013231 [Blyttiomyces sp. JEL0837]|nr:hypothetical protein HDU76_013231 [Blyttiomyces sp. JEL0837]
MIDLPIVDLSSFVVDSPTYGDTEKQAHAAAVMKHACETYGAFNIANHGVSPTAQKNAFNVADDFFLLSDSVKSRIPIKKGGFTRGYIGVGGESGGSGTEVKEAFSYGFNWPISLPPTNPLQGPNVLPEEEHLPDFQTQIDTFYNSTVNVAEAVTLCLSKAFNMPELPTYCGKGGATISLMRIFRYYPYAKIGNGAFIPDQDRIGSSPHTDWGFLTLILSEKPGLQVSDVNGSWETVRPEPGCYIVNAGDYLSLITNGRIKSPLHRVVTATEERTSFVFFYYPDYHSKIPVSDGVGDQLYLFKDQGAKEGSEQRKSEPSSLADKSFGEYIAAKWASVFREGRYS